MAAGVARAKALAYHRRQAEATAGTDRGKYHAAEAARLAGLLERDRQCEDCGTPLSDPVSVERRKGRDCYAKQRRAS